MITDRTSSTYHAHPHAQTKRKQRNINRTSRKNAARSARTRRRAPKTQHQENVMNKDNPRPILPPVSKETLRVIPLGGVEEIGKNMTVFEYEDDIIIVDAGIYFPGNEVPGVDYIIPDTTYLEQNKHKIRGIFITHGHLDHIGAIPYIIEKLGNPPIYARRLSAAFIKKRQDEFPHTPPLDLRIIEKEDTISIGKNLKIKFFAVTHTIPESMGIIIETPLGNVVHTGDLKVDHKGGVPLKSEVDSFRVFQRKKNLVLLADSTNAERPGFGFTEREVHENLRKILEDVPGRLIIGTFASLLERIIFVIQTAESLGKKVVIEGRAMKVNVEIGVELGLLKPKRGTIIPASEMSRYPDNKIVILATGAQGDAYAALMRIANRQHKYIKIQRSDTIVLSSSVIPGNERDVQKLKDNLSRQGARILTYAIADVHSSGHASQGEMEWIISRVRPQFFIPIHGYHYMLRLHGQIAQKAGVPERNVIIPDNGSVIEFFQKGERARVLEKKAPTGIVMIDALGQGDIKEVVVRDRKALATDGMFVIVAVIDVKTGKIRKSPDIISRGFIYLKESQDLLNQVRLLVKKTVEDSVASMRPIDFDYVKNNVREKIGGFLYQQTKKRPMILPVILEV